jgi:acetyl esterase/lipase
VRDAFGAVPNPEGTQPVNLVTPSAPPMFLASGTSDPIVRVQNTENLALKLKAQGVWVTERYYEGFGHMEPVMAIGALWRWRMPVLDDMLEFFQRFGAFPSGAPRVLRNPDVPQLANRTDDAVPMGDIAKQLDSLFQPISR